LVIPAFNEETRLAAVVESVRRAELGFQIVVVDDGSADRTAEVARALPGVILLRHPFNLGYGAAIQTGYKFAARGGATLLAQMDADGQHDPAQLPGMIERVEAGGADLVIGSRFLSPTGYSMGFAKSAGRRFFQGLARALAGLRVTDPTSGFQVMNGRVLELYTRDFFPTDFPDLDILLLAHRAGLRIEEIAVTMAPSPRASTLHSGLAPAYYLYKMTLSIWAGLGGVDRPALSAEIPDAGSERP
ncbi:MAG: glycosyltransferase family 2 protein, partial [Acidobacteriota bacterium]